MDSFELCFSDTHNPVPHKVSFINLTHKYIQDVFILELQRLTQGSQKVGHQVKLSAWDSWSEDAIANDHTSAEQHEDQEPSVDAFIFIQQLANPNSPWYLRRLG